MIKKSLELQEEVSTIWNMATLIMVAWKEFLATLGEYMIKGSRTLHVSSHAYKAIYFVSVILQSLVDLEVGSIDLYFSKVDLLTLYL